MANMNYEVEEKVAELTGIKETGKRKALRGFMVVVGLLGLALLMYGAISGHLVRTIIASGAIAAFEGYLYAKKYDVGVVNEQVLRDFQGWLKAKGFLQTSELQFRLEVENKQLEHERSQRNIILGTIGGLTTIFLSTVGASVLDRSGKYWIAMVTSYFILMLLLIVITMFFGILLDGLFISEYAIKRETIVLFEQVILRTLRDDEKENRRKYMLMTKSRLRP